MDKLPQQTVSIKRIRAGQPRAYADSFYESELTFSWKPQEYEVKRAAWTKEQYEKIHVIPHTTTKKFLWGLWSTTHTETLIYVPTGIYRLTTEPMKATKSFTPSSATTPTKDNKGKVKD